MQLHGDLFYMKRKLLLFAYVFLFLGGTVMAQNVRKAAVAGKFYDADPVALAQSVMECYGEAKTMAPLSKAVRDSQSTVQAVIVPHAGYVFSGAVAASAFLRINPGQHYKRIILIGPSHHVAFDGASVATAFTEYATPLGNVPVDTAVCNKLVAEGGPFCYRPDAHNREHCLEVQLPLLQGRMTNGMPPIVPIIIGTQRMATLMQIAEGLKKYLNPDNLFVISSDFSHYPSYANAEKVDGNTGTALETGNINDFIHAIAKNDSLGVPNLYTSACGQCAIATLLLMAQDPASANGDMRKEFSMHHIAYLNSGDSKYGGKSEVVGYHSFVLTRKASEKDNNETGHESFSLTDEDKTQLKNIAWNAISPESMHKEVKLTPVLSTKVGVFVTLTEDGRLRGCIGHFGEDIPLWKITREMAHAAAFEDPRFPSLRVDELNDISIEISVLTPLKRINDISEFQYGKQGIYMRKGGRSGTFLPQVADEVNWTKEEFLGHCAQDKAGIGWDGWRTADLYTYEAIIF